VVTAARVRRPPASTKIVAVIALAAWLTGCGAHHHSAVVHATVHPVRTRLTGAHPCPAQPGFTCSTLRVPLDHAGQARGTLALAVGIGTPTGSYSRSPAPATRSSFGPAIRPFAGWWPGS
jgi:hypothetical protein